MIVLLLACGGAPADTAPAEAPVPVAADPPRIAPGDDPSWGYGCSERAEPSCLSWAKKARRLGQDYREFLEPSCGRAYAPACLHLGRYLEEDGEPATVTDPFYERGCTFGNGDSCRRLSRALEGDEKHAMLEKACRLRSVWACKDLGLPLPTW